MIGLIRVFPPPREWAGTIRLEGLPEPPASRFSAFAARCEDRAQVRTTLEWYGTVRTMRPALALGLVCDAEACAEQLAGLRHPLTFLLRPDDLVADGLPGDALAELRASGVEGLVLEKVLARYGGGVLEQEDTLRALLARACAGGSVMRTARDLAVTPATVRRRLSAVGIQAGKLRSQVRLWAYRIRVDAGVDPAEALRASGWTSQSGRRKAARRID